MKWFLLMVWLLPHPVLALPPAAERLQKRLVTVRSLRAEFVQRRAIELTGETLEAPGLLAYRRPYDFRLTYFDEDRQEIVVEGDSLWVYMPLENQAILYAFDPGAPGSEVFTLFGGQDRPLEDVFAITEEPWAGHADALRLKPRTEDPGYPFDEMRLVVDARGFPALFFYAEVTGDEVSMRFTHVEANPPNISTLLEFELPDSVDILDAREVDTDLR